MNTMLNTYFTFFILGFNIKPCRSGTSVMQIKFNLVDLTSRTCRKTFTFT